MNLTIFANINVDRHLTDGKLNKLVHKYIFVRFFILGSHKNSQNNQ